MSELVAASLRASGAAVKSGRGRMSEPQLGANLHSEFRAKPLTWLSVEFRCFFRMGIECSGEIGGF
jgi:hypothetical protein